MLRKVIARQDAREYIINVWEAYIYQGRARATREWHAEVVFLFSFSIYHRANITR